MNLSKGTRVYYASYGRGTVEGIDPENAGHLIVRFDAWPDSTYSMPEEKLRPFTDPLDIEGTLAVERIYDDEESDDVMIYVGDKPLRDELARFQGKKVRMIVRAIEEDI